MWRVCGIDSEYLRTASWGMIHNKAFVLQSTVQPLFETRYNDD